MRGIRIVASVGAVAALVVGCTGPDEPSPSARSSAPTAAQPAPSPSAPPADSGSGCRGELTYADEMDYSLPRPEPGEFVPYDYASQIQEQTGGSHVLHLGVGHERADFRLFSLTNPMRVVVDVAHPD